MEFELEIIEFDSFRAEFCFLGWYVVGYSLALHFSEFDRKGNCVYSFLRKSRFLWLLEMCWKRKEARILILLFFFFFSIIWDPRKVKPSKINWDFFIRWRHFFFLGTELKIFPWITVHDCMIWLRFWFFIWWNNDKSGKGVVTILLVITYIYESKRVHKIGLNWWFIFS